jgi:hypothetical protein
MRPMGTLDDAIREHLDLKRRKGAPEDELKQKEAEAFGRGAAARRPADQPPSDEPPAPSADTNEAEPEAWEAEAELLEPDEVLPEESLEPNGTMPVDEGGRRSSTDELAIGEVGAADLREEESPAGREGEPEPSADDLLEETPDFLEETPEHDRLWFEQKPPKDFDLD